MTSKLKKLKTKKILKLLTIIVRQVVLATIIELFLVTARAAHVTVGLLTLPKTGGEMV